MKLKDKNILLVLIVCVLIKFIFAFPLDNSLLPSGTDTSSHLFKVWYIVEHGITNWNYYWYAGFAFFRYYPPLSYIIPGLLGKLVGFLFAYKLINNVFLVLAPVVFLYFLKEFKFSTEKTLVALIFFSFMPIFSYYLVDGRYPSLVNVVFALLAWIFLKRAIDGDSINLTNIFMTSIFLGISILTHHMTSFIFMLISFGWAIFYRMNMKTFYKLSAIIVCSLLLVSWWLIPFFMETWSTSKSSNYGKLLETNPLTITGGISLVLFKLNIFSVSFGPQIAIIVVIMIGLLCLLSLFTLKDKITKDFIVVIIVIAFILLFIRYKRVIIFLPIPLSILVTQGIFTLKRNMIKIIAPIFFILLIISYLSIKPQTFPYPEIPDIPKDGRVLFLPLGQELEESGKINKYLYSVVLSPIKGNENLYGWFIESQNVGKAADKKLNYYSLISQPLNVKPDDYYKLLSDGWTNYVVVNKNYNELINYFNSSNNFHLINMNQRFAVFEIEPKSTYVEINGESIVSNVTKLDDNIIIQCLCQPGNITIKESYHSLWVGSINDKKVDVEPSENGFINLKTNEKNNCTIHLSFENPEYYMIFTIISLISCISFIIYLIIRNIILSDKTGK
jgi:uncharacterized membrane protein